MFCLSKYEQLSFLDQISDLNNLSFENPLNFLKLLKENVDIKSFIPNSFRKSYYKDLGAKREFYLPSVLAALLLQHIFNIPTVTLLYLFLILSAPIRDFCMFDIKVPDEAFFSRFKTEFEKEIALFFESLVSEVLPMCKDYDENLPVDHPQKGFSKALIYDTSGLKPQVKENNPKFTASEINKQKRFAKIINNEDFNPYAAAYKNLPKQSFANPEIKLDFANGHFGYFYKFGILTNGFGIPLRIHFFDKDFYANIKSDFETPEEQKYEFDNASLKPVLMPFLPMVEKYNFSTFLGDSEFDSYDNFGFLKNAGFQKVLILINSRNSSNPDSSLFKINSIGTPLCPLTNEEFIPAGPCKGKNRSLRFKYLCPKTEKTKGSSKLTCSCENPCRETKSTVTTYTYPDKDFRLYPGIQRNSDEWASAYKSRTIIEREISSLKKNPSVAAPRTLNTASMRADLFIAASARLITVILAHAINKPEYMRSRHKLIRL